MNVAPLAFLLVMCGKKKKPADAASAAGATPAAATAAPTAGGDRKPEEKKSKKETSKKSEKKSVKSKKEKSKKEKSKKESVKEGKSGVGKSPADKSDKKDEAAKADAEKDKEGDEKKESGGDDKEKKEGEDKDKKESGDDKDKKEGDEAGGDKLPQTADVPQQTAMQLLKKELAIDPPELRFNKDGGVVRMILTNNLGTRVAVKIKCSDNELFRVNPVFTFIEKEAKFVIEVSRNSGNPKPDKLAVVVLEVPDDAKDPQAVFKDAPADKLITSSVPMFTN